VKDAALFKCPADRSEVRIAGQNLARVRTVAMNNYLSVNSASMSRVPVLIFTNISQIKLPAALFVILDERADSLSDGTFWNDASTLWQIIDFPGAYHNGGGSLSFADGHVEIHRWNDPRTNPILQPGEPLSLNVNLPGNLDVLWLQQHAVGQRSPP
jgi:prepilin-type processing-associated H-X9-DG protein